MTEMSQKKFYPCKIAIVTDAWNQTNGVAITIERTAEQLRKIGHQVLVIEPNLLGFKTYPVIGVNIIKLAFGAIFARNRRIIEQKILEFAPDYLHIATEGPIGIATRKIALTNNWKTTTSFHTQWAWYWKRHLYFAVIIPFQLMKWFHKSAQRTLVPTIEVLNELKSHGFSNLIVWGRSVDRTRYKRNPEARMELESSRGNIWDSLSGTSNSQGYWRERILKGPVFLYCGRVTKEKNIEAFLNLDLPGVKIIIGFSKASEDEPKLDPYFRYLTKKYASNCLFVGKKTGQSYIDFLSLADVFVFPSKTDTFGIVQIEAMATGVPVAAFPGTCSSSVVEHGISGMLSDDLQWAAIEALNLDRARVVEGATKFSPEKALEQFINGIVPI